MPLTRNEKILLGLLVLAALAVRIFYAWSGQWSTDPDRGVASLMALHMAEGRAWPVFFYGQGYMGSVEPLVASLFCRLFGVSGFTVCLGTAIPAALLLVPLYLLARRIAGPVAGVGAALFLVVGPDAFVAYMSSPRGGYAAILVLNSLILLLAARLADLLARKKAPPYGEGYGLGLCSGLGWWVGPMVLPALAAAGVVLAVALRGRLWQRSLLQAAAAFAVGSAPWWWWNAHHEWISLSMRKSVGGVEVREVLGVLALRTWKLMGWPETGWTATALLVLLGGGLLALAGVAAWRARREQRTEAGWALAAVLVYALVFGAAYSVSSFSRINTLRYLLPLLPVLAVAVGLAAAQVARLHRGLAALLLLAVVTPPIYGQWTMPAEGPKEKKMVLAAPAFVGQAAREGIDVVFAEYPWHWVNFAARGAVPVVEPGGDAAPLNDRAGLLARNPGYWPNGEFAHFFQRTLTRKRLLNTSIGRLYTEVRPAPHAWRVLAAAELDSVREEAGDDLAGLVNGRLETAWSGESAEAGPRPAVLLTLREPRELAGLLLFSPGEQYPLYAAVDGRADEAAPWQPLVAEGYMGGWYWSGPQAYFRDLYYHLELRWAPVRVKQVRLRFPPSAKRPSYAFALAEVVVLEAAGVEAPNTPPDLDVLAQLCRTHGVQQLYANRWVGDRLAARNLPGLAVDHSPRLDRGSSDVRSLRGPLFPEVTNLGHAAFFSGNGALGHNRAILETCGHAVESLAVPGGTLLVLTHVAPDAPSLAWTGDLLLRAGAAAP